MWNFRLIVYIAMAWCFGGLKTPAQVLCSVSDTVHFERIFGADKLLTTGADTLNLNNGNRIIYSCRTCDICCMKPGGREAWRCDLSAHGCRLLALKKILANSQNPGGKQRVFIQTNDKRIFILGTRNGKLRQVKW